MKEGAQSPALCTASLGFIEYPRDQTLNSANEKSAYTGSHSNTQTMPEAHGGEGLDPRHTISPDSGDSVKPDP